MLDRFLSETDVRAAVPMSAAIDAVRHAFAALAAGEFELPLRTALGDGRFLSMSAHHVPTATAIVKAVSVAGGRDPAIEGAVAYLTADASGTLVMDAGAVTALRTGAVVGVATDALAPADARTLTLIGLGKQAPDQLRAVRAVREIERVTLVARSERSADSFRERHADDLRGAEAVIATTADEAVQGADIVCCATPSTEPLFAVSSLSPRAHVNAVGAYRRSMRELPDELLRSAVVVVDEPAAALEESGEIHHAIQHAGLRAEDLIPLGDLVRGRRAVSGRSVFKSVGLAIQDWAIGHAIAGQAGSRDVSPSAG
jgi:ornithine cyclodeaminase